MTITLYGIPNCDTVKKARTWLDAAGVAHEFHDYKKAGVDEATLRGWIDLLGWETVLNRKGTTFRKLPEETRADLNAERAVGIMMAHPSAIKRPIVVTGDAVQAGFDPAAYAGLFSVR